MDTLCLSLPEHPGAGLPALRVDDIPVPAVAGVPEADDLPAPLVADPPLALSVCLLSLLFLPQVEKTGSGLVVAESSELWSELPALGPLETAKSPRRFGLQRSDLRYSQLKILFLSTNERFDRLALWQLSVCFGLRVGETW